MQESENPSSNPLDSIKKQLQETLQHFDVLQKQSLNLFDKPEVYHRAFQLADSLDAQTHALNDHFPNPEAGLERNLQDLFFNVAKIRKTLENLKLDVHKWEFQRSLVTSLDHIKELLNKLT